MEISNFKAVNKSSCKEDLLKFEINNKLLVPEELRNFILSEEKFEILAFLKHPLYPEWNLIIDFDLGTLDELKDGFVTIDQINRQGIVLQHQDKVLAIGHTHDGPVVYLGYKEPIKNLIFLSDFEAITEKGEIPLYFIANSIKEFITLLSPITTE